MIRGASIPPEPELTSDLPEVEASGEVLSPVPWGAIDQVLEASGTLVEQWSLDLEVPTMRPPLRSPFFLGLVLLTTSLFTISSSSAEDWRPSWLEEDLPTPVITGYWSSPEFPNRPPELLRKWLSEGRYQDLQAYLERLQRHAPVNFTGVYVLDNKIAWLVHPQTEKRPEELLENLRKWEASSPSSLFPPLLRGQWHLRKSRDHRGTKYAREVTEDQWRKTRAEAAKAVEALERAIRKDPESYLPWVSLQRLALFQGGRADQELFFREAQERSPGHPYIIGLRLKAAQVKWGGLPGEEEEMLHAMIRKHPEVPRIAKGLLEMHHRRAHESPDHFSYLAASPVREELVWALDRLWRAYPNSLEYLDLHSTVFHRNKLVGRQILNRLGVKRRIPAALGNAAERSLEKIPTTQVRMEQLLERLELSWKGGFESSRYPLAKLLHFGIGTPVDLARARELFLVGAKRGEFRSQRKLAKILLESPSPEDRQEGEKWLRAAANQDYHTAHRELGEILMARGGESFSKGLHHLEEAARLGEHHAKLLLGRRLELGDGLPKDLDRARKLYQEVGGKTQVEGFVRIGLRLLNKRNSLIGAAELARPHLERAASGGHIESYLRLGALYAQPENRFSGIETDRTRALEWYERGLLLGGFLEGEVQVTPHRELLQLLARKKWTPYRERLNWLEAQGRRGPVLAQAYEAVARRFREGLEGFPVDPEQSTRWLERARSTKGSPRLVLVDRPEEVFGSPSPSVAKLWLRKKLPKDRDASGRARTGLHPLSTPALPIRSIGGGSWEIGKGTYIHHREPDAQDIKIARLIQKEQKEKEDRRKKLDANAYEEPDPELVSELLSRSRSRTDQLTDTEILRIFRREIENCARGDDRACDRCNREIPSHALSNGGMTTPLLAAQRQALLQLIRIRQDPGDMISLGNSYLPQPRFWKKGAEMPGNDYSLLQSWLSVAIWEIRKPHHRNLRSRERTLLEVLRMYKLSLLEDPDLEALLARDPMKPSEAKRSWLGSWFR